MTKPQEALLGAIAEAKNSTKKAKTSGNKKIKNATKSVQDGVSFDSHLEKTMYNLLKMHNIDFEFQKMYCIQEGFRYGNDKIRPITLTVDFYLPKWNIIIDSKGWANDVAPVKYKMLKYYFSQQGEYVQIWMPSKKIECEQLITKLLK